MIEPTVTMTFNASCDHCGCRLLVPGNSSHEARVNAIVAGWTVSEWLHDGRCPRQTIFCALCVKHLEKEENADEQ